MQSLQTHLEQFHEQGFTVMRGVLDEELIEQLKSGVLRAFEDPEDGYGPTIRTKMFERGEVFERLMMQAPVVDFAEALLGANCHMFAMNSLKTPKNEGIDQWHVDEELMLPLPEGIELDPRIRMPVHLITCIYYLVDVPADRGPTQLIPGSHRSGRHPDWKQDPPVYKDATPVSILANKGDCLLFNGQTWHRGSRNESDTPRIVQQVMYGKRWVAQRFYPFINYEMPQEVIDRWKDHPRMRKLLGMHPRGAYG